MVRIDRSSTSAEQAVVRWMLSHASVGDGGTYDSPAVDTLRVIGGCACGCASIDFADTTDAHVIGDATALYPDGTHAGLLLWGSNGAVVGLEVYEMAPGNANRMPAVAELRTWAEMRLK